MGLENLEYKMLESYFPKENSVIVVNKGPKYASDICCHKNYFYRNKRIFIF